MKGLIVDYCGVLDGTIEDQQRWQDLLTEAREAGKLIAILSNDPGGPGADHIRAWQADGYVDEVILSGETETEKPNPEIFLLSANRLGLEPNECILVDDSILNVRGAVDTGLIGVYYQQFDRAVIELRGLLGLDG